METKCALCGAPLTVVWTGYSRTLIALDRKPHPEGTVSVIDGLAYVWSHQAVELFLGGERFRNHFESCKEKGAKK